MRRNSRLAQVKSRKTKDGPRPAEIGRVVIGIHACDEIYRVRPKAIRLLRLAKDPAQNPVLQKFVDLAKKHSHQVKMVQLRELDELGGGHQGIAITVSETPKADLTQLASETESTILILDGLEDPHNLGAVLRSAWLMGIKVIFVPQHKNVGLTPTVCKIASGGAEHVALTPYTSVDALAKNLKDQGFWIYGLSGDAEKNIFAEKYPAKTAWVLGAESSGLRRSTEGACDVLLKIPQSVDYASYNASVALGMALAETFRQKNPNS